MSTQTQPQATAPSREKLEKYLRKFKVGGQTVDLTKAFPLTLVDYRKLGRENVNVGQIADKDGNVDIEKLFVLVKHLCTKVAPTLKDDEIESTLTMKAVLPVVQAIMVLEEGGLPADDDPT